MVKKKKEEKKVTTKRNVVLISLIILIIVLFIYLINLEKPKGKLETESPSQITTPEILITTTIQKTKPTKFISDLKCVDSYITMTFTNILKEKKEISDFSFFVAGKVNRNPDCELTELEPGESTFCKNLNAGVKFRKKVEIAIGYPVHYEKAVVDCSNSKITGNIISDIKELFIKLFGI